MATLRAIFDKAAYSLGYERKDGWQHPTGIFTKFKEAVKKAFTWQIKRSFVNEIKAEMDTFRYARSAAEDPSRPDRRDLLAIYHNIILDDQIVTQRRVALNTILRAPFQIVDKNAKPSQELADLFKRPWFLQYLRHDIDAEFYGHSLLEFNPELKNGEFTDIVILPREMVRPEFGDILQNQNATTGIQFRSNPEYQYVLEIGDIDDLGLLLFCAIPAIRKKYSDTDWSIASEKFGMPFLVVKTQSRQDAELDAKEAMAAKFAANGYAILDDMDEVELLERNGTSNAHLVYLDRIKLSDEQIAKIINGQNSTSDVKSFVGSAQVHERILNDFTFARMTRIEYNINFVLIPFLISHGYKLDGWKFQFKELIEKDIQDPNTNTDNQTPPAAAKKETTTSTSKKKLNPKLNFDRAALFYEKGNHCCDSDDIPIHTLGFDLTSIFEKAIKDVYDGKIKQGELNAELWKATADTLLGGIDEGTGRVYADIKYTDPDKEFISQLRSNVMSFAAFKNHANMTDTFKLLTDASGNKRPWSDFKAEAQKINANYNVNWLQAEYQTAIASSRMAANWQHLKNEFGEDIMLRYETVGDARVREAHRMLDGTTKPLNDKFWKAYYPPNGWRCRCDVVPVPGESEVDPTGTPSDKDVPLIFRHNTGESLDIFSPEHPYFLSATVLQKKNIQKGLNKLRFEQFGEEYFKDNTDAKHTFKKMIHFPNALGYDDRSGGFLVIHKKHMPGAIESEVPACVFLKNKGYQVELLDESSNSKDQADAFVNDMLFDLKQMKNATNFNRCINDYFENAAKKCTNVLIEVVQDVDNTTLFEGLKYAAKKNSGIKNVWYIKNGKLHEWETEKLK